MITETDTSEKKSEKLNSFWNNFHIFPYKFEQKGFQYWYIVIVLPYFLLLSIAAITSYSAADIELLKGLFWNDYGYNLSGLSIFIASLAFVFWQKQIPGLFHQLIDSEMLHDSHHEHNGDLSILLGTYLEEYRQRLASKRRFILISILFLLSGTYSWFVGSLTMIPHILYPRDGINTWLYNLGWFIKMTMAFTIYAYGFGACVWVLYNTAKLIKELPLKFGFNYQPNHPDQCGGLKPLGDFCIWMVSPILIGIICIGILVLRGVVGFNNLGLVARTTTIFSSVGLFMFLIPLALITFFNPLWNVHVFMLRKRRGYEHQYALMLENCLNEVHQHIQNNDVPAAKVANEKYTLLQALHPNKIGYPVWPFDRAILLKFTMPQIISSISVIISYIKKFL